MIRAIALVLALSAPAAVADKSARQGGQCYALWEAQCFQVHDAQTRDITHHILLTNGPVRIETEQAQCPGPGGLLAAKAREALLEAFNARIDRIDGCARRDELKVRTAPRAEPLVERFQRLKAAHENRTVHLMEPPETGS